MIKFSSIDKACGVAEERIRERLGDLPTTKGCEVLDGRKYGYTSAQILWHFIGGGAAWTWVNVTPTGEWEWDHRVNICCAGMREGILNTATGEWWYIPEPDPASVHAVNAAGHNYYNPFGLMDR